MAFALSRFLSQVATPLLQVVLTVAIVTQGQDGPRLFHSHRWTKNQPRTVLVGINHGYCQEFNVNVPLSVTERNKGTRLDRKKHSQTINIQNCNQLSFLRRRLILISRLSHIPSLSTHTITVAIVICLRCMLNSVIPSY